MVTGTIVPTQAPPRGVLKWWPLRLVVLFVVMTGLYVGCLMLPELFGHALAGLPKGAVRLGDAALVAVVMIAAYRAIVGWLERRNAAELGAAGAVPQLLGALAIGTALFSAVFAVLAAFGSARLEGWSGTNGLAVAVAVSLAAVIGEEIVFRGVVFRVIEDGLGTLAALIVSAALFGLIHLANPGATLISGAATMLEAGLLLASSYVWTRSLWLPIGLHFGWNFTEGGVLGAAVSGGKAHGLVKTAFAGPAWLSGGAFDPEALIVAVALCLALALVLIALAIRRGEWRPLRWRLKTG